jgi:cytoskeletal protein RodZ
LQNQTPEVKKDPIVTQKYNQKTNNSVKFILVVALVLLLGWGVNSYYLNSGNSGNSKSEQSSTDISDADSANDASGSTSDSSSNQSAISNSPTPTPKPTPSATTKSSSGKTEATSSKAPTSNANAKAATQSPRTFASVNSDQGAVLKWIAPKNIGNVVAFELYGRAVGQSEWVLLSTVTIEQLDIEVDLTPSETSTEFRVASLLDNDKQVFNKTIITLPGSIA